MTQFKVKTLEFQYILKSESRYKKKIFKEVNKVITFGKRLKYADRVGPLLFLFSNYWVYKCFIFAIRNMKNK